VTYSRYDSRKVLNNSLDLYKDLFDEKGVRFIRHFSTPNYKFPTKFDISKLDILTATWSRGQSYWKIAEQEYGDPEMWWVIAWFNKKPTEAHMSLGDVVLIPKPLERILNMLGV
jgi:hypothetical protein